MFNLEVFKKSLKVRTRDFSAIANLLQPGIIFIDSAPPSPVCKTKIIKVSCWQCYWDIHTFF